MTFHLTGIMFVGAITLLTACGGGGDDSSEDTGAQSNSAGNNPPMSSTPNADAATSLYDVSRIRAPSQAPANLIANGQFENIGDWQLCGAGLQSESRQGQYLRLDSAPDCPLRGD